jgi:hypothetical protein
VIRPASLLALALTMPHLTAQEPLDLPSLRALILPSAEDQEWQRIPWRQELRAGLQEATGKRLPVLLWAMNGHPLGCT